MVGFLFLISHFLLPLTLYCFSIVVFSSRKIRVLYNRSTGLHGFQFLCLFVYKYFLDTGFTLINCRSIGNSWVGVQQKLYCWLTDFFLLQIQIFAFSGESCYNPHVLISFIAGIILIVVFTFVIPVIALIYVYNPQVYNLMAYMSKIVRILSSRNIFICMMLSLEASKKRDATCGLVSGTSGGEHCS